MSNTISIVDYGAGNMFSVARAFEHIGTEVSYANNIESIQKAHKLILPGVGSFKDAMMVLQQRDLIKPILHHIEKNKPLLGICLGMQLLFDFSEEGKYCHGLGIIPGAVKKIPAFTSMGTPHKIPHIAWNNLTMYPHKAGQLLFNHYDSEETFYFLHSYRAEPYQEKDILARSDYNGIEICAAVAKENVFGVQFHPEKSRETGLNVLRNFLSLKI